MRNHGKGCVLFEGEAAGNVLFSTSAACPRSGLLNVADPTVDEGDFQILVHIDPFRTEIYDLLRLALDGAHLVDGEAEGERGRGPGIAALADRLLFGMVCFLSGGGQFTGYIGVGPRRFLGVGGVDGTGAALGRSEERRV